MSQIYQSYQPTLGIKGLIENARNQAKFYKDADFNPLNNPENPNAVPALKKLKNDLMTTKERFSLISQIGQKYAALYQHEKKLDQVSDLLKNQVNGHVSKAHIAKLMQVNYAQKPEKNYFIAEVTMPSNKTNGLSSEKEITYRIVPLPLTKAT